MTNPWAVTVMGDMAFVLDSGNDRVQAFKAPARRRGATAGMSGAADTGVRAAGIRVRETAEIGGSQARGTGDPIDTGVSR